MESNRPSGRSDEHQGGVVQDNTSGSPEALVRDDTWWINCLRVFLIGTLLVVAIGISTATFKVLSKMEHTTFRNEFETVSTQISQLFLQDMYIKLWVSSFATLAVTQTLAVDDDFPSASTSFLNKLSLGVGDISYWNRIGFSPLLWTERDRNDWEAAVTDSNQFLNNNICHVCGEGMEVTNSDGSVSLPGYGSFTCSMINEAGLNGRIPEADCPYLASYVKAGCQCTPVSISNNQTNTTATSISTKIFRIKDGKRIPDNEPPPFSPVWQASPPMLNQGLLYNQMGDPIRRQALNMMIETKLPTFSRTRYPDGEYQSLVGELYGTPQATIFYPLVDANPTNNQSVIGSIAIDFPWISVLGFGGRIPPRSSGVAFVVENNQGQMFTFHINPDLEVAFVGEGDLHDPHYDSMVKGTSYDDLTANMLTIAPNAANANVSDGTLLYKIRIYPSEPFQNQFETRQPVYYTALVASIFVFTSAIFILYDILVRRRQIKVMKSALQSNAIVTNVFPDFVTSRLMTNAISLRQHTTGNVHGNNTRLAPTSFGTAKHQLRILLGARSGSVETALFGQTEPIADFFPNVTVLFADITGFTAWSSEREPVQVFQLLESVYQTFDTIAAKHDVFKVETIGDCYVAVTGLPVAQPDHAVRMARFAYDIMLHMHELAASLESMLGPGTGTLSIRVGLHSGSVTGGVLRGDKARFQLFGDTMNTSARMESTGEKNRIQASDSTAALLQEAGLERWVNQRDTRVSVKGKGDMQTFWIDPDLQELAEPNPDTVYDDALPDMGSSTKGSEDNGVDRLINWNTDLLETFLRKLVAARKTSIRRYGRRSSLHLGDSGCKRPIHDVTEVIEMFKFNEKAAEEQLDPESVELSQAVHAQLRNYVACVAGMYRNNPFHNFEHASHVAMSANKILKRIIKPEDIDYGQDYLRKKDRKKTVAEQIHNSTFGISSDALMQFTVIFAAVIHDVDHTGVSNAQLVKERSEVALMYDDKCVAEQNSVQIAWDLLMEDQFSDLRACIYTSGEEKSRFRQLIVNAVIATDIADGELQTLRKNRWHKAFYDDPNERRRFDEEMSCKATVVFEYIIQASDVAHTMQHWHVYSKWNERLFEERYTAYLAGREEKDPTLGWYNGEIWFFDNYIIPLARKLETCGVFGVSSDEYLNYALANRHEWERRGQDIVEEFKKGSRSQTHANKNQLPCIPLIANPSSLMLAHENFWR